MMIRVYLDDLHLRMIEIPLMQTTTCADVIGRCTASTKDRHRHQLAELWRGHGMSFIITDVYFAKLFSVIVCAHLNDWGNCHDHSSDVYV